MAFTLNAYSFNWAADVDEFNGFSRDAFRMWEKFEEEAKLSLEGETTLSLEEDSKISFEEILDIGSLGKECFNGEDASAVKLFGFISSEGPDRFYLVSKQI